MKGKLTQKFVDSVARAGRYADKSGTGLLLVVGRSGSKSWIQRTVIHGRQVDIGLGSCRRVRLVEARKRAFENWCIARDGGDPRGGRDEGAVTFADGIEATIALMRPTWRNAKTEGIWRATLLPAPLDALQVEDEEGNAPLDTLVADLANLKGGTAVVPSMAKDWVDLAGGSAPNWNTRRIGAEPPASVVELRRDGHNQILAAAGIPPGLFETRDAGAARESLRQLLHMTVSPLARILETEARDKLGVSVELDFTALHASDVQGRARAFKSLVDGGMPLPEAAAASGILQPEE